MKAHWNNAWHPDRATHQPIELVGGPNAGQQMTAARDCDSIMFVEYNGAAPAIRYRRRDPGNYECRVYVWEGSA